MTATVAPTRPVLRYHGGKWVLAPWIISHFPPHRIYVEPFGGAASVLIRKDRCYCEVYNDANGEIVNVFRVLQDPETAEQLRRKLYLTPFARAEFALSYEPCDDSIEQARRTIMRTFMGFGSNAHNTRARTGFRANSSRSGTTGSHDWAHYPEQVRAFTERLRGVVIEQREALDIIHQHDGPTTLFYCDPPYAHAARGANQAANYGPYEMADADHIELSDALHGIQGMAVVSGYRCDLYDALYADWERIDRAAYADGARARVESLWLSPGAQMARRTLL